MFNLHAYEYNGQILLCVRTIIFVDWFYRWRAAEGRTGWSFQKFRFGRTQRPWSNRVQKEGFGIPINGIEVSYLDCSLQPWRVFVSIGLCWCQRQRNCFSAFCFFVRPNFMGQAEASRASDAVFIARQVSSRMLSRRPKHSSEYAKFTTAIIQSTKLYTFLYCINNVYKCMIWS